VQIKTFQRGSAHRSEFISPIYTRRGALILIWMAVVLSFLQGRAEASVTLAELKADPKLTPERFVRYFADFKFELGREVRPPEVFLARRAGDCDDFATLAADVLREKGYTTKLVAVFMEKDVHVVCYVKEAAAYLDYNCRQLDSPLVKCDGGLSAIAGSVAASFRSEWRSASEYTFQDNTRHFVMTEFR
jgi:hypothetical protein